MNDITPRSIDSVSPRADIDAMLSKIRSISTQTKALHSQASSPAENVSPFHSIMNIAKNSIQGVSQSQMQTDALKDSYLSGDNNVSISQVMISSIKSKVAFEGLIAVRNKLIDSYKEIMNMQI
jgi:flagellar hook-basal body complex protein FliE